MVSELKQRKGNKEGKVVDPESKKNTAQAKGGEKEEPKKIENERKGIRGWALGLFDEIDNSTLILFRIMWGLIMVWECYTFIRNDYVKMEMYYMRSSFYPKYYGFYWVNAFPGDGMYIFIWALFVSSFLISIGLFYRLASCFFFFGWTYIILLDASQYLNHFYLIALMAFFLILFPSHARLSLDSLLFPSIYSTTMPRYVLYFLRFEQVRFFLALSFLPPSPFSSLPSSFPPPPSSFLPPFPSFPFLILPSPVLFLYGSLLSPFPISLDHLSSSDFPCICSLPFPLPPSSFLFLIPPFILLPPSTFLPPPFLLP